MDGEYLFLMEMLLTLGTVVGFGIFELVRLNRSMREDAKREQRDRPNHPGVLAGLPRRESAAGERRVPTTPR